MFPGADKVVCPRSPYAFPVRSVPSFPPFPFGSRQGGVSPFSFPFWSSVWSSGTQLVVEVVVGDTGGRRGHWSSGTQHVSWSRQGGVSPFPLFPFAFPAFAGADKVVCPRSRSQGGVSPFPFVPVGGVSPFPVLSFPVDKVVCPRSPVPVPRFVPRFRSPFRSRSRSRSRFPRSRSVPVRLIFRKIRPFWQKFAAAMSIERSDLNCFIGGLNWPTASSRKRFPLCRRMENW